MHTCVRSYDEHIEYVRIDGYSIFFLQITLPTLHTTAGLVAPLDPRRRQNVVLLRPVRVPLRDGAVPEQQAVQGGGERDPGHPQDEQEQTHEK